jgi:hypothetical protein
MEIKSWINKTVRIKREYLRKFKYEGREYWETTINDAPINDFLDNPKTEIFKVMNDVYGAELFTYLHRDAPDTKNLTLSHQLILSGGKFSNYPFLWDAKYFAIVE